jgi:CheY-like chemotaxis protein
VLLVEDDPAARRFYADALAASGFRVEETAAGVEAVRVARARPPAAVVADLGLPDFDGFEVCRQVKLRPESSHVPVIAITGRAMALRDIEMAEHAGFHAVLIKPCPAETLVATISRALVALTPKS